MLPYIPLLSPFVQCSRQHTEAPAIAIVLLTSTVVSQNVAFSLKDHDKEAKYPK